MRSSAFLLWSTLFACSQAETPRSDIDAERWRKVKQDIRSRFSDVEHVTTEQLREELARGADLVVLVDVRAPEEFAVSHLRGARNVERGFGEALAGVDKDRPIVTYCSVGFRSARAALELKAAGYRRVRNYIGSIFEWANHGHPLVTTNSAANKVHPYDEDWGKLLRPNLR